MKRLIVFLASVLIAVSLVATANAITMSSSSGVWTDANGIGGFDTVNDVTYDSYLFDPYLTGVNTNMIRWGSDNLGNLANPQSGLDFVGVTVPISDLEGGSEFNIGTLTHHNWPIWTNTEATEVFLTIDLFFSAPPELMGTKSFNFTFDVDETPNTTGDNNLDADIISFPSYFASERFVVENVSYTLQLLGFGNSADSLISEFSSPENGNNQTQLWGKITTNAVPEPSTMLLFGLGLLSMGAIGRKTKS